MDDTDITALLSRDLTAYQVAQAAFEEARQTLLGTLTAFVGTDPALRARRSRPRAAAPRSPQSFDRAA